MSAIQFVDVWYFYLLIFLFPVFMMHKKNKIHPLFQTTYDKKVNVDVVQL